MDDLTFYLTAFVFISCTGVGIYYIYITFFKPKNPVVAMTTGVPQKLVIPLPDDEINKMDTGFVLLVVMFVIIITGGSGYIIRKRQTKRRTQRSMKVEQTNETTNKTTDNKKKQFVCFSDEHTTH